MPNIYSGTMPTKAIRTQQITECVTAVAKFCETDPIKVMTAFSSTDPKIKNARNLLWHHFHQCGLSFHAIGRIWKLSETHIQKRVKQGSIRILPEELLLLKTLPRIHSSLDITPAIL